MTEQTPKPSKTKRKHDMHARQKLGERLVNLPVRQYNRIILPENLKTAIHAARQITDFEGLRRQMQYIGKLMRNIEIKPIEQALKGVANNSQTVKTAHAYIEKWRADLLENDNAIAVFLQQHPEIQSQQLRQLIRQARKDAPLTSSASQNLFKLIKQACEKLFEERSSTHHLYNTE